MLEFGHDDDLLSRPISAIGMSRRFSITSMRPQPGLLALTAAALLLPLDMHAV